MKARIRVRDPGSARGRAALRARCRARPRRAGAGGREPFAARDSADPGTGPERADHGTDGPPARCRHARRGTPAARRVAGCTGRRNRAAAAPPARARRDRALGARARIDGAGVDPDRASRGRAGRARRSRAAGRGPRLARAARRAAGGALARGRDHDGDARRLGRRVQRALVGRIGGLFGARRVASRNRSRAASAARAAARRRPARLRQRSGPAHLTAGRRRKEDMLPSEVTATAPATQTAASQAGRAGAGGLPAHADRAAGEPGPAQPPGRRRVQRSAGAVLEPGAADRHARVHRGARSRPGLLHEALAAAGLIGRHVLAETTDFEIPVDRRRARLCTSRCPRAPRCSASTWSTATGGSSPGPTRSVAIGPGRHQIPLEQFSPALPPGTYSVRVQQPVGEGQLATALFEARVTGTSVSGDLPVLLLGEAIVPLSGVREVRE